jgi:hypothetical protein
MAAAFAAMPAQASTTAGLGNPPQTTQSDAAYRASYAVNHVTNVDATTQRASCYRPEVPLITSNGPNDWYNGMQPCLGTSTTGEDLGGSGKVLTYPTQVGSAAGYPATGPMVVNDHSESDLRVDPADPTQNHIIASSKWFISAEGYNHVLGFYESRDGGKTWPVQGHIPGYEGFTDNTDPVGAFDGFGNYYEFILPYQFAYVGGATGTGSKLFQKSNEPNPALPSEATSVSVRPATAGTDPTDWITTHTTAAGVTGPDYIEFDDNQGKEPDKQWIAIDHFQFLPDGKTPNPNYNTIYAMFVNFDFAGKMSKAYVSTAKALPGGQHTDWTPLQRLPSLNASASDTYLLPHVDPNGVVWTTITNFPSRMSRSTASIGVDYSTDGGVTWHGPLQTPAQNVLIPPLTYANTTFTDGIEDTFTVGTKSVTRTNPAVYPLYVSWEDFSAGNVNILLSGSMDGGKNWSKPIQVNDNASAVDEFQPNLAASSDGKVSVNFYDRRLACPLSKDSDALASGIARDKINPAYGGALPPYGALNYCVNTSIQFYQADLTPIGNNIRLSQHTWDPQLNAPDRFGSTTFSGKDTFIGDYFGNDFAGSKSLTTSVSTFDDGSNGQHFQEQIIAIINEP